MATTVLLAGDEPRPDDLLETLRRTFLEEQLRQDGFEIAGPDGRADVVIATGGSELERWCGETPVIVLGGPDAVPDDRVLAFRRGCDDYVAVPFHYEELVERIRAVVRRSRPPEVRVIMPGVLEIDERSRVLWVKGVPLKVSHKEFALLTKLARDPARVYTKDELLREIWGYRGAPRSRTLDSHVSRLRRKLRVLDPVTSYLDNEWGVGYRLIGSFPEPGTIAGPGRPAGPGG